MKYNHRSTVETLNTQHSPIEIAKSVINSRGFGFLRFPVRWMAGAAKSILTQFQMFASNFRSQGASVTMTEIISFQRITQNKKHRTRVRARAQIKSPFTMVMQGILNASFDTSRSIKFRHKLESSVRHPFVAPKSDILTRNSAQNCATPEIETTQNKSQ